VLQAQHPPSLNRRALLLLIADEFWSLNAQSWAALSLLLPPAPSSISINIDPGTGSGTVSKIPSTPAVTYARSL